MGPAEIAAALVSLVWAGFVAWLVAARGEALLRLLDADPMGFAITMLGLVLPVALLWVAVAAARTARAMREEGARLRAAIDAMRAGWLDARGAEAGGGTEALERRLDTLIARQDALADAVAALCDAAPAAPAAVSPPPPSQPPSQPREAEGAGPVLAAPARPRPAVQPALALGVEEAAGEDGAPLGTEDFVRALDFPRNERDVAGFEVLRRALDRRDTAQVVTAAQDVLSLLSQDGIFMDDLAGDPAPPMVWRAFADGVRGPQVAEMGSIRDRSALTLAGARMREDPVFRDAAHHFLRAFDRALAQFAPDALDGDIAALAATRSGRAFALLGQVTRMFD
ncbi:hypothetical protein [Jannaschia sp. W003]|uniref:hypothetical protein n=1 Tax=Jannaschia sp. W003 TaxID=2867012 RepID=UPI0021A91362|nr:hypothetical protein [Jannaschia sp. W003]UWQ22553.1 hypothetical protein K3554_05885 [Jannaschia sp. W003]